MYSLPSSNIPCQSNYRIFAFEGLIVERFLGLVLEFINNHTCPEMKAHILGGKELSVTPGMST